MIKLSEYIAEQETLLKNEIISSNIFISRVLLYTNFIRRELKLGMFIPCVNGEVFNYSKHGNLDEYNISKSKVSTPLNLK